MHVQQSRAMSRGTDEAPQNTAGEELIVMHDFINAIGALSTVNKNKGEIFFTASRGDSATSQPRIRLTNLFCTATPLCNGRCGREDGRAIFVHRHLQLCLEKGVSVITDKQGG